MKRARDPAGAAADSVAVRITATERMRYGRAALAAGFVGTTLREHPDPRGAIGPWLRSLAEAALKAQAPDLVAWRATRVWNTVAVDRQEMLAQAVPVDRPAIRMGSNSNGMWARLERVALDGLPLAESWAYLEAGARYRIPSALIAELQDGEFIVAELCPP